MERLDLYRRGVDAAIVRLDRALGPAARERRHFARLKEHYSACLAGRDDRELGGTFFNSVTRRLFETLGVDAAIEFVDSDFAREPPPLALAYERHACDGAIAGLIAKLLRRAPLSPPWADLEGDAREVALRIESAFGRWPGGILAADVVPAPFYRGKGAYLVGRPPRRASSWRRASGAW